MRARFVTAVAICLLSVASTARSQEPNFAKDGFYVGAAGAPNFTLDGVTFDGTSVYQKVDGDEFLILPHLERKNTFRGFAGFRSGRGAFEVGYEQTTHPGTFAGFTGEATFHSLSFDERIFLLTRGRIQPYGLLGLSVPWLTVKDGAFLDNDVADGSFRGFGINTEAGVTVFPQSRVGISAGYRYRTMWFDSASGVSRTAYKLRPRFRETAGSVSISAFVTF
ncbi:MAG TPA: outer membrane beta-barrel protein [Vicinamibacterales bacterium]|nr:outer membrane beta-barrel protein [Vicinamibacterales bacterium]